ncbi:MAG: NUDIX hydrolase, partial [Gammaproteobacteria bacterium]
VTPVPAATVLLCRDSERGLEVFMVVRHHEIDFATGALVFPGGKTAKRDTEKGVRERCQGVDGLSDETLALQVASIREAFEECGVLLACQRGADQLIAGADVLKLDHYREPLSKDDIGILEMLEKENLVLACNQLNHFSHWITPQGLPKRFDTHFYIVKAPADHLAVHDGGELVDSVWITVDEAMKGAESGKYTVMVPTKFNLLKLGQSDTVEHVIAAVNSETTVTIEPVRVTDDEGMFVTIPENAGYPVTREKIG